MLQYMETTNEKSSLFKKKKKIIIIHPNLKILKQKQAGGKHYKNEDQQNKMFVKSFLFYSFPQPLKVKHITNECFLMVDLTNTKKT